VVSLQCKVCSAESATEYGLSATESATLGPESLASEALGRAASPEVVQPASVAVVQSASVAVVQPASVADQGASAVEASADSEAAADYPTTVDRLVWASHRRCEMYLAESATGLSEVVEEAGDLAVNSPTRVAQPAHFQLQRFQLSAPEFSAPTFSAPAFDYAAPALSYTAPAVSYGCTGSLVGGLDLYPTSATAEYYGDWGLNYLQGPEFSGGSDSSFAIDSYDISPNYQTGLEYDSIESVYGAGIGSGLSYDTSAITGDSLIESGFPSAAPLSVETDFAAPMLDYGAVPTLPSAGTILPQLGDQMISTPNPGTTFGPIDGLESPSLDGGFGAGLPDAPSPNGEDEDINSTRRSNEELKVELASISLRRPSLDPVLTRAGISEAVLGLSVPEDAKVYINGKLTATPGTLREYVSRKLKAGKSYSYQVKAVIERDGERIVRSKLVRIKTGTSQLVKFDFTRRQVTKLVLKVPADAEVLLDGHQTKATGIKRVFSTEKLTNDQSWKDYHVEVRYQVAGRQVVREQSLTLTAGATEVLEFGSQVSGEQVASN